MRLWREGMDMRGQRGRVCNGKDHRISIVLDCFEDINEFSIMGGSCGGSNFHHGNPAKQQLLQVIKILSRMHTVVRV